MTGQEIMDWIKEHNAENEDIYFDDDGNITIVDDISYWSGSRYNKIGKPIIVIS